MLAAVLLSAPQALSQSVEPACEPDMVELFPEDGPAEGVRFIVEVADDPEEQARGLMFRTEMAPDSGMIFVFDEPRRASFWMRNTILPLDMIFIADNGRVVNVAARTTPFSERSIQSQGPVRAVLEVNAGLAESLGIGPGTQVSHPAFQKADAPYACPR